MVKIDNITRRPAIFCCAFTAAIIVPVAVFAQTPSPVAKCQAAPQQQTQNGQIPDGQAIGGKTANGQAPSQSLSGNLANCNGVLKPPSTGDQELVEPAPQTGNMPVIKPGETPKH